MRKILVIFVVAILILSGCASAPTGSVSLPSCFEAETKITYGETDYGVMLSRFADGYWRVELMSPLAVKGLIFDISGENTDVGFNGLRFTFDTTRFPVGSVVTAAVGRLDRLFSSPIDTIKGDEQCLASGDIEGEGYTLTLTKNNVPMKLEMAASGLCIEFLSFVETEINENQ